MPYSTAVALKSSIQILVFSIKLQLPWPLLKVQQAVNLCSSKPQWKNQQYFAIAFLLKFPCILLQAIPSITTPSWMETIKTEVRKRNSD